MNGHAAISFTTTVDKSVLLARLRENYERHKKVVSEAQKGHLARAQQELKERLKQLADGKMVPLAFHLSLPRDHSEVYETAIEMLEMHTEDKVELRSEEFTRLVQDRWDWSHSFWVTTRDYSATASDRCRELGI